MASSPKIMEECALSQIKNPFPESEKGFDQVKWTLEKGI